LKWTGVLNTEDTEVRAQRARRREKDNAEAQRKAEVRREEKKRVKPADRERRKEKSRFLARLGMAFFVCSGLRCGGEK
jgi:hypothetical protein